MIKFDNITRKSKREHNPNCPQIPHHSYKILTTGASGSGKIITLPNLINHQQDIDRIYLYPKDLYKRK